MAPIDRQFCPSPSVLVPSGLGLLGVVLGLGLLAGCSGFTSGEKPLPDSTFTRVLTELHLARARQNTDVPDPPGLRDSIFARYNVRPAEFDSTLHHYSRRPEAFGPLYQSIIDTLQALQYPDQPQPGPESVPDSVYRGGGPPPDRSP